MTHESMPRIERVNVAEQVAARIARLIEEGRYRPGDRLPSEQQLCEQLGVGRTSVREGLKILQSLGLAEVRHGEGAFVASLSISSLLTLEPSVLNVIVLESQEVKDIMYVRRVVEMDTAALAARRRTDEDVERLRELMAVMEVNLHDPDTFLREDLSFHVEIARASKNVIYPVLIQFIRDVYIKHSAVILRDRNIVDVSFGYHRRILDAIIDGDAEGAKEQMRAHLEHGEALVLEQFEK